MANVVNEAREFLAAHWQPDMDLAHWKELVIDHRWSALRWPEDCMGRSLDDETAKEVEALFLAAGAVVVNLGAVGSHASIVSRELGIPCVASVTDATHRIPDGATITVDGAAGTITIVALP